MARKKAPPGALLKRPLTPPFIAEWRKFRSGMTQEALAARVEDLLGMSFTTSTLSRIEKGVSPYNQRQLEAIASALGCQPADLLNRNPLVEDAPWSLVDHLQKASPERQRAILRVVSAMLDEEDKGTGTDG